MAKDLNLSLVGVNAGVDAICALANTGYIRVYNGTKPATPQDAPGATLLAELRFGATAFAGAVAGVAAANPITDDTDANATGTAAWFRVLKSDGTTALWDGTAGVADLPSPGDVYDLQLNSAAIQIHVKVSATSMTFTWPKGY
jgi:hypothetical protein